MIEFGQKALACLSRFIRPNRSQRWLDEKNLLPEWDQRTRMIADLVPPGTSLIEFGAGRRQLPKYLPPGCRYTPSDLVDRGGGTVVLNLNQRPLPDLHEVNADTAIFGGVLEYSDDLEGLVEWIGGRFSRCIASYECAATHKSELARLSEVRKRLAIGWVNTFHEQELIELFTRAGLRLVRKEVWKTPDGDEPMFLFERAITAAC